MRTIGVVTVSRSDYGIYLPLLRRIQAVNDLNLALFVSGMHLSPEFGRTVDTIVADGFPIAERVEMLLSSDTPEAIAKSIGLGVIGFSQAFARSRPDILLVVGDRFEMFAAVVAALPFQIPVAHVHGGEVTIGAIDDGLRHSITKLSHIHFAATKDYARRLVQLGEEPSRVSVSGAPALDHLLSETLLGREELASRFKIELPTPPLLVTFHPVTREFERTSEHIEELLAALEATGHPIVFTLPNADTRGRVIARRIREWTDGHSHRQIVENFGTLGYFSLMKHAAAMVGNSSSGIIEAASFELPVVNVGNRQEGRLRAANVIDCPCERGAIRDAVTKATSVEFKAALKGLANPYGDGHAAERIVEVLRTVALDERLLLKSFHDIDSTPSSRTFAA